MVHPILWGLAGFAAFYFAMLLGVSVRGARQLDLLAELPMPELARWPRVSLISPARDEEVGLETALRSKFLTDYPDFELIAVDDRSRDQTGAIIDGLAMHDPRVRAIHITELPAGWLGKLNALARGAAFASGEWLLLCDADTVLSPDALRRTVGYSEQRGLDFLGILPEMTPSGPLTDAAVSAFLRALIVGLDRGAIEDPKSKVAIAGGVFTLVRRSALARAGGFEAIKMEVVDDIGLAQLVKAAGAKCSIANGLGLVRNPFYRSAWELVRGLEKNAFAVLGYRLWLHLPFVAACLILEAMPFIALACGGRLAIAGVLLLILDFGGALFQAVWLRRPLLAALLLPVGILLVNFASLRSAIMTSLRGGIAWRETFYPLEALRKGRRFKLLVR